LIAIDKLIFFPARMPVSVRLDSIRCGSIRFGCINKRALRHYDRLSS